MCVLDGRNRSVSPSERLPSDAMVWLVAEGDKPLGLPGGKLEPGETRDAALTREILEELNCDVPLDVGLWYVSDETASGTLWRCNYMLTGRSLPNTVAAPLSTVRRRVAAGEIAGYVLRVLVHSGYLEPSTPQTPPPVASNSAIERAAAASGGLSVKTRLNNLAQENRFTVVYDVFQTGPVHAPTFTVRGMTSSLPGMPPLAPRWRYVSDKYVGATRKEAEARAAMEMLANLEAPVMGQDEIGLLGAGHKIGDGPMYALTQYIFLSMTMGSVQNWQLTPPSGRSRMRCRVRPTTSASSVWNIVVSNASGTLMSAAQNNMFSVFAPLAITIANSATTTEDIVYEFDWDTAVYNTCWVTFEALQTITARVSFSWDSSGSNVSISGVGPVDCGSLVPINIERVNNVVPPINGAVPVDISGVNGDTLTSSYVPVTTGLSTMGVTVEHIAAQNNPLWVSNWRPAGAPMLRASNRAVDYVTDTQSEIGLLGGAHKAGDGPTYVRMDGTELTISDDEFDNDKKLLAVYLKDVGKRARAQFAARRLLQVFFDEDEFDGEAPAEADQPAAVQQVTKQAKKPRVMHTPAEQQAPVARASQADIEQENARWAASIQRVSRFVVDCLSAVRWWYRNKGVSAAFFKDVIAANRIEPDHSPEGRGLAYLLGNISQNEELRFHASYLALERKFDCWPVIWEEATDTEWAPRVVTDVAVRLPQTGQELIGSLGSGNSDGDGPVVVRGAYDHCCKMGGSDPGPLVPVVMSEVEALPPLDKFMASAGAAGGSINRMERATLFSGLGTAVNPATISSVAQDAIRAPTVSVTGAVSAMASASPEETHLLPREYRAWNGPVQTSLSRLPATAVALTMSGGAELALTATGNLTSLSNAAAMAVVVKNTDTTAQGWPTADIAYITSQSIENRWNAEAAMLRSILLWHVSSYAVAGDYPDQLFYPLRVADPFAMSTGAQPSLVWNTPGRSFGEDCGGTANPVFPFGGGTGKLVFLTTANDCPAEERGNLLYLSQGLVNGNMMREQTIAMCVQCFAEYPFAMPRVRQTTTMANGTQSATQEFTPTAGVIRVPGRKTLYVVLPRGQNGGGSPPDQATANAIVTVRPTWGPYAVGGIAANTVLNVSARGAIAEYSLAAYLLSWSANGAGTKPGIAQQSFTTFWKLLNDSMEVMGAWTVAAEKAAFLTTRYRPLWAASNLPAANSSLEADNVQVGTWLRPDAVPVVPTTTNWPQATSPAPALWVADTSLTAWNMLNTYAYEVINHPTTGQQFDPSFTTPRGLYYQTLVGRVYAATFQLFYAYLGLPTSAHSNLLDRPVSTAFRTLLDGMWCTTALSTSIALPPVAGTLAGLFANVSGAAPAAQEGCMSVMSSRIPPEPGDWQVVWSPSAAAFLVGTVPAVMSDVYLHSTMTQGLVRDLSPFVPQNSVEGCTGLADLSGTQIQFGNGTYYSAAWLPAALQTGFLQMTQPPDYCPTLMWNNRVAWESVVGCEITDVNGNIAAGVPTPGQRVMRAPVIAYAAISGEVVITDEMVRCTTWIPRFTNGAKRLYVSVPAAQVVAHNQRMLGVTKFALLTWAMRSNMAPPQILTQVTKTDIRALLPGWSTELRVLDVVGPNIPSRPGVFTGNMPGRGGGGGGSKGGGDGDGGGGPPPKSGDANQNTGARRDRREPILEAPNVNQNNGAQPASSSAIDASTLSTLGSVSAITTLAAGVAIPATRMIANSLAPGAAITDRARLALADAAANQV